jgi:drug/metabolite transporter (DMT)-like permease
MRELAAVGLMAGAMACFAAMDTTTKLLAASVPLLMVVWARNVFQLAVVTATLLPRRGRALLRTRRPGLQLARAILLLGTNFTGIVGLSMMPLAEFTSILLLTPLALTALAALVQKEPVPALRWLCVLGGLSGALLVLRPGAHAIAGIAVLAAAIVAVNTSYQWLTSRVAQLEDTGTTQFYSGAIGTVLCSLGVPFVWQALPGGDWALLALVGLLGMSGHQLLIQAYARATVSTLTPYLYLQLAFATLAGWLVFSHGPDAWALAGIALIAGCGIFAAGIRRGPLPAIGHREAKHHPLR